VKRTATILIVVIAAYAAFLAWHQPLRGPLTELEVRAAFGDRYSPMREAKDGRAATLIDFFLSDDGRPFFMINLNALPEHTAHTQKAERAYASYMAPRLLSRASYPVLSTEPIVMLNNSLGTDLEAIERLVVVRYRSRRDFLEIIATPEFREAVEHKSVSLDGWYSAPASVNPVVSLPQLVLILLITVGFVGSWLIRQMRARSARR
jgi:hypothetical protein